MSEKCVEPCRYKSALGKMLVGLVGLLACASNGHATVCTTEYWKSTTAWSVRPNADGLTGGTVLATASATTHTTMATPSPDGAQFDVFGYLLSGPLNEFDSTPVSGVPGVSLRIKWDGVTAPEGFKSLDISPNGTVVSNAVVPLARGVLNAAQNAHFRTTLNLELVVTDVAAYQGGGAKIVFQNNMVFLTAMEPVGGDKDLTACGTSPVVQSVPPPALQSVLLPVPSLPTCEFDTATLNQTVELPAVRRSSVANNGAARSAGMEGEKSFSINARNCAAGAVFDLYFTDANANGSTDDFLRQTTNSDVGIRIYHDNAASPIIFGPAPIGSTLPERAPITLGSPSADKGASYAVPFTAQYVRTPGATGKAFVGEVGAKAKVTVVYP